MEKKEVGEEVEEKEVKEEDDKEKLVEEGGDKSEQWAFNLFERMETHTRSTTGSTGWQGKEDNDYDMNKMKIMIKVKKNEDYDI